MTIYNYLQKLQKLQRDTLKTDVNLSISTRFVDGEPWLCVSVTKEGWTEKTGSEDYLSEQLYSGGEWQPGHNEVAFNRIVEFFNNLLKK